MRRDGKFSLCLACGLALNAGLRADDVVLQGNPYAPIVARNIFNLNPPPPISATPAGPPPKITANGIMTIFGSQQALFKVAGNAGSGQPAKDASYILSEGQRQDDIEVTCIDEKGGIITFNNHGTVQQIPLTTAPASPDPNPAVFVSGNGVGDAGRRYRRGGFGGNHDGQ